MTLPTLLLVWVALNILSVPVVVLSLARDMDNSALSPAEKAEAANRLAARMYELETSIIVSIFECFAFIPVFLLAYYRGNWLRPESRENNDN